MWKDWIRPFLRPLPQWSTVAVAPPQQMVTATLRWDGKSADVTADHTVASLKPLVIATSIDAGQGPVIEYCDSATGRLLGVLRLAQKASVITETTSLTLYDVAAGEHRCLAWPRRPWNTWLQNRLMQKNQSAPHAGLEPAAVQQLMIAYLCPRPVILVSVDAPGHQNIFPMDLIGPLQRSGLFSLALRSTNVSMPVMREMRRVVLSSIPATMKAVVYKLSAHHKQPLMDWNALPFPARLSREFGIPAVAAALRVQELDIVHSQEIGSHMFFLGRVISDEHLADGTQLHHTAGFHQAYRRRLDMPLAEV
ncbi:NADH-FMN oxidoreductase RutF, flavin reductase (DIM6/NTAB) family [Dyella sp. OK004]|uniref:flavin reductase n=1 Tax=Dyella sp. OK004 TaxID=1855292 RepID=UPI0008EBC523|nr:flavin reductase [Dyella sp. OK004]SFS18376.1 NADH-FMN oxidoreductase RutF, flavin reductase (DIM6/NTAB) family [Dyella sp. OK004]